MARAPAGHGTRSCDAVAAGTSASRPGLSALRRQPTANVEEEPSTFEQLALIWPQPTYSVLPARTAGDDGASKRYAVLRVKGKPRMVLPVHSRRSSSSMVAQYNASMPLQARAKKFGVSLLVRA